MKNDKTMTNQTIPPGKLHMVDLKGQYAAIRAEIDAALTEVVQSAMFIGGPRVAAFARHLEDYLNVRHVIPCANGTDALQIALMTLGLEPGDEVILPAFTYVATAEVVALLKLTPVMVDVRPDDFNIDVEEVKKKITPRTRAIVPVHLFGQCADMEPLMNVAEAYGLYVVEDNAQAIGASYHFSDGSSKKAGTIGHIGCTSFFPSKNLGCYGDGGAMMTADDTLAEGLQTIANHGQGSVRYYHDVVGVNSRLDALQAAVLDVKLNYLDRYADARRKAAAHYDTAFEGIDALIRPVRNQHSDHVFHQYTLRVSNGSRDALKEYLDQRGIPCAIYYPVPLYRQKAYTPKGGLEPLPVTEQLCREVISLPMHTELTPAQMDYIAGEVIHFLNLGQ